MQITIRRCEGRLQCIQMRKRSSLLVTSMVCTAMERLSQTLSEMTCSRVRPVRVMKKAFQRMPILIMTIQSIPLTGIQVTRSLFCHDCIVLVLSPLTSFPFCPTGAIFSVAWHPTSDVVASGSADDRIFMWQVGRQAGRQPGTMSLV